MNTLEPTALPSSAVAAPSVYTLATSGPTSKPTFYARQRTPQRTPVSTTMGDARLMMVSSASATASAGVSAFAVQHCCAVYGCIKYNKTLACQCNAHCRMYNNCCWDYMGTCAKNEGYNANMLPSCASYGCVEYNRAHKCQCNPNCGHYRNCCPDYSGTCLRKAR